MVHDFQRLLQEEETINLTCAHLLYHFGLVRSLTNLIRRPGRDFSNDKLLEINSLDPVSPSTSPQSPDSKLIFQAIRSKEYPWWARYFKFAKKSFEVLHYVFNWVEESLNIIINDFQYINYLFCLIPIGQSDIFIECTTILEDLLTIKTKSMLDLKKIPILKRVVRVPKYKRNLSQSEIKS